MSFLVAALINLFFLDYAILHLTVGDKFQACRVSIYDCGKSNYFANISLEYIQHHYAKCKYIIGNLVICDLMRLANGSDPDLSFLENIEEVSGYVLISRNQVKNIPLKSLKIIRGEPSYQRDRSKGALVITRNGQNRNNSVHTIDLRNLIAIQRGDVIVEDNPSLCYLAFTIDWSNIFVDPSTQRYIPDRRKESISQNECIIMLHKTAADLESTDMSTYCHENCKTHNPTGSCWGPGPDMCQKLVKCNDDNQKYCVNGSEPSRFCDDQCLGGCTGTPMNCTACKNVENDGKCMTQCPPQFIVNRAESRTEPNPDFKYNYHDTCVKTCPAPFLVSKAYCVIECDLKREVPENGTCQACPPEGCPSHCTQESIYGQNSLALLDVAALRKFKSCVYYTGKLYLSREAFQNKGFVKEPITDMSILWNLQNLKAIVGSVYLDFRGSPPGLKNMTFLENLRSIVLEIRGESAGPVLQLMNAPDVEYLGFRSLQHLDGPTFIMNMSNLCYLTALKKIARLRNVNSSTIEECAARKAVCHSECLPQLGCWGPGANMCRHCCNLQAGDDCVSKCTDTPGFYEIPDDPHSPKTMKIQRLQQDGQLVCRTLPVNSTQFSRVDDGTVRFEKLPAKKCGRCHEECAETCYGPGPHQCIGACKHFEDNGTCVRKCQREKYIGSFKCLPCHPACLRVFLAPEITFCSGPGNFLGLGGCTSCSTVLKHPETKTFECIENECPRRHFTASYSTSNFVTMHHLSVSRETLMATGSMSDTGGMIRECKPCHPYCDMCTANGTHVSICHSCVHWWFKSECVEVCPPTETYDPITPNNGNKTTTMTPGSVTQPPHKRIQRSIDNSKLTITNNSKPSELNIPAMDLLPGQKMCQLCHEECVQGCTGGGPGDCKKCRNFKLIMGENEDNFTCVPLCPPDKPQILRGICLNSEEFAKMSGRAGREFRDRILIGVAIGVILFIIIATILGVICLKRRVESERWREKLFSAYTNLNIQDKELLIQNQTEIREPNMGRLEMINANDLEYDPNVEPLGKGAFGTVYRGVWRLSKQALEKHKCPGPQQFDVAIKVIQNDYPISPSFFSQTNSPTFTSKSAILDAEEESRRATARATVEELLQEATVMASVEHKHCLPLIGVCLTRDCRCLVAMFLELGSLDKYVKKYRDNLDSLTLLTWAEQIADGMAYLEARGIIHRDLAARNVLVQRPDLVQITDFGLAKMLVRRDQDSVVVPPGRVPIRWLAIETLQDWIYSHKTDVWTYGVTLWEIFTYGCRPYADVDTADIKEHVMKGGRLSQPAICTLDVYLVMLKCWMEDAEARPTFLELKRTFHEFCNAPGRYIYFKGDAYEYNRNTVNGHTFSSDNQESHPLLSNVHRGLPDGEADNKINGSVNWMEPSFADRHVSGGLDELHRMDGLQLADTSNEETDSWLPKRSSEMAHWPTTPLRTPTTAGPSGGIFNPRLTNEMKPTSVAPRSPTTAPLAPREDSWLADAPGSPNWRNSSLAKASEDIRHAPIISKPTPHDDFVPSSSQSNSPGQQTSPNDEYSAYLEPKTPMTTLQHPSEDRPIGETQAGGEEYLMPKAQTNNLKEPTAARTFGVSNMEYFYDSANQPTNLDTN